MATNEVTTDGPTVHLSDGNGRTIEVQDSDIGKLLALAVVTGKSPLVLFADAMGKLLAARVRDPQAGQAKPRKLR